MDPVNLQLLIALIVIPSAFYAEIRLDQNVLLPGRFFYYVIMGVAVLVAFNVQNPDFPRGGRWCLRARPVSRSCSH